jgi:hypothetical protein
MIELRRCALSVLVASVLLACADSPRAESAAPTADVSVTVRNGGITAPDSARAGWAHVRVDELEGEHILVFFRLPATSSDAQLAAFSAALDSAPATPAPGVAIGGPEIGAHGDVTLHLTPGVYVLACVSRGDDGHRHAIRGESKVLRVGANASIATADSTPRSTQDVRMVDFAYVGPDHWPAGEQLLRIENTGKQDHQLRLERLHDGVTLQQWMQADDQTALSTPVSGMARVGAGETAYLPVTLGAGSYVAYCLVADATSKQPHIMLGMLRAIQVP